MDGLISMFLWFYAFCVVSVCLLVCVLVYVFVYVRLFLSLCVFFFVSTYSGCAYVFWFLVMSVYYGCVYVCGFFVCIVFPVVLKVRL